MSIRAVPTLDKPVAASDSETRYGYVAYHDIALGNDHKVQPDGSPYYKMIPCRELIPFTNITVGEIDIQRYGAGGTFNNAHISPIKMVPKTAKECAAEMEKAYQAWAFVVLTPLTGFDTDRAFRIFQAIQPFPYRLADIEDNLADAESRIDSDVPYQVSYQGEVVDLMPLSEADKAVARQVLPIIQGSASFAVDEGRQKIDLTIESMNSRFSGGDGKRAPDPHDKYLSSELGMTLPKLITNQNQNQPVANQPVTQTESAESLDLKRREIELRERELALREMELGLRAKPEAEVLSDEPMAAMPNARPCAATKADGTACKRSAITDSEFCVAHTK